MSGLDLGESQASECVHFMPSNEQVKEKAVLVLMARHPCLRGLWPSEVVVMGEGFTPPSETREQALAHALAGVRRTRSAFIYVAGPVDTAGLVAECMYAAVMAGAKHVDVDVDPQLLIKPDTHEIWQIWDALHTRRIPAYRLD